MERKTEWLADLLVEDGLWAPGLPGKGMMKAGEEKEGSKGWLWPWFLHLLEWRGGMERLGVEETGWTPLFFSGKARGSDMSLKSGMGSGRQGKGMNHMGPLLTSESYNQKAKISSGTTHSPTPVHRIRG